MTTKHTPGPWFAKGRYIGTKNHMSYIGECSDQNGNWTNEPMAVANSLLIAAAPDLLAVLTKIRGYHVNHHVLHEIDAAITKATGEAPKNDDSEVPA